MRLSDLINLTDCDAIKESLSFSADRVRNHEYMKGMADREDFDEQHRFYEGVRKETLAKIQSARDAIMAIQRALKEGAI